MRAVTTSFRPVGQAEFDLIRDSAFQRFPPRLPGQPYFYPVLNVDYATQIAKEWNTKDPQTGYAGYVLRFQVDSEFLTQYAVHQVGDVTHLEYWILAADLAAFNEKIVGTIEVIAEFHGLGGA
jgi:hypothetical protein